MTFANTPIVLVKYIVTGVVAKICMTVIITISYAHVIVYTMLKTLTPKVERERKSKMTENTENEHVKENVDIQKDLDRLLYNEVCNDCKMDLVKFFINSGASPIVLRDSCNSIHVAAVKGRHEYLGFLISKGYNLDLVSKSLKTALHYAIENGSKFFANKLVNEGGCSLNVRDEYGRTALHLAVEHGNEPLMLEMLKTGRCDVNATDDWGLTPLHIASRGNHLTMVDQLITFGADVNAVNLKNFTPLHFACSSNAHVHVVRLLLRKGADRNISANSNAFMSRTALFMAKEANADELVKALQEEEEFTLVGNITLEDVKKWCVENDYVIGKKV